MKELVEHTTHFVSCDGRAHRLRQDLTGAAGNDAYNERSRRREAHFAERRRLIDRAHDLECAALGILWSDLATKLIVKAEAVRAEYDALCKEGY